MESLQSDEEKMLKMLRKGEFTASFSTTSHFSSYHYVNKISPFSTFSQLPFFDNDIDLTINYRVKAYSDTFYSQRL